MHRVGEVVGFVDGQHRALDLVGEAGEVIIPLRHVFELHAHFGDQLAVVLDLDLGQAVGVLSNQVAEAA